MIRYDENKNKRFTLNGRTLDKYQLKAISCNAKYYLVVAGAGSGKTFTIVAKIKYLIEVMNYKESEILCISFTNETVNSLANSLALNNYNVDVRTFHKFALSFIDSSKFKIASADLLEYITDEYFYSYIYFDDTYKLFFKYTQNNELNSETFKDYFKKIAVSFIRMFKSQDYDFSYFLRLLFLNNVPYDDKVLLIIIFKIYFLYIEELNSACLIDFEDIIKKATSNIDKMRHFKYKYIIIDEYQDTSILRYKLIKKICDKFSVNLMAVGDDYQSIYAFNGCNLDIFLNFKQYFSDSKIIKLKYTYRNARDVALISRYFILKNRKQIRKRIKSNKFIKNAIVIVYSKRVSLDISNIIQDIDDILILGRNNFDINMILDNEYFSLRDGRLVYLKDESKKIRFLTVHSSKGLESSYVIVLNLLDSYLGFPSQIKDYNLFKYINNHSKKEDIQYSEERRLFYVALTRTKSKVYLFTNKTNPSIFIKELIRDYKFKIKILDFE